MNRSSLLVSTAVGLTLAASGPVQGLGKKQPDGSLKHVNAQHALGAPGKPARDSRPRHRDDLKMTSTVIFHSDQTETLPGGFALDNQTSIACKTSCIVEVQAQMNLMSYYSYNTVALCPIIDGYFTNGSCYFEGSISSHGFRPVTLLTSQAVGSGTHMASMYLYTLAPAYLSSQQTDYHVYK